VINRTQKTSSRQRLAGDSAAAEALALQALAWLAGEPEELGAFLAQTGMDGPQLRAAAGAPELLAGVLDYLLGDETRLLAFCTAAECDPALPARLRRLLPGAVE
jgi:hypothetical protein